jgi:hypothetical protein
MSLMKYKAERLKIIENGNLVIEKVLFPGIPRTIPPILSPSIPKTPFKGI